MAPGLFAEASVLVCAARGILSRVKQKHGLSMKAQSMEMPAGSGDKFAASEKHRAREVAVFASRESR